MAWPVTISVNLSNDADLKKMYEEDPANAAKIDFEMRQQRESFNKLKVSN